MPVPRSAATTTPPATPERRRLNRKAVLTGAVELADHLGSVEALTIRKLADHLGVKPMSIYHHVPNKDEILNGMVDAVFAEIELPERDGEWQAELRRRAHSARAALARHPWATGMLDSRTNPGPATLTHHDAVIACLRASGFRPAEVSHTIATVDAYVYGFALQGAALPGETDDDLVGLADELMAQFAASYPSLAWFTSEYVMAPGYAFGDEFAFGLDLVLEGLASRLGD